MNINELNRKKIFNYLLKMIELKTIMMKQTIPEISIDYLVNFLLDIVLRNKTIYDINDIVSYIFNISNNKIIEYLNNKTISNKNLRLDDFQDMFK